MNYEYEEKSCYECGADFAVDEKHHLNADRDDNERYAPCPDCGRRYTIAHIKD